MRLATSLLGLLALAIPVGGRAAAEPIVSLDFSSDVRGSMISTATLSGRYRLEIECTGTDTIGLSVQVDSQVIETLIVPCEDEVIRRFEVNPPVSGDVDLAVGESPATGRVRLYRD